MTTTTDKPPSDFVEDLVTHFPAIDVSRVIAYIDRMEQAVLEGDVLRWSLSRNKGGFAARITTRDNEMINGFGPTMGDAIKAMSQNLIAAGMRGAPSA